MKFSADIQQFQGASFRQELLAHIYNGETLAESCGLMKINPAACGLYMLHDEMFAQEIRKAQAFRVDLMVDELPTIDQRIDDGVMAGVISKNIQWVASKRNRDLFGDKIDVSHIHTINISQAIADARARTIDHIAPNTLIENNSDTDNVSDELDALEDYDPLS